MIEIEGKEEINRFLNDDLQKSFDLAKDLLFRVHIIKMAENACIHFINMHHIISDGWSMNILFRELSALKLYEKYILSNFLK